jgi:hypothetical protein
MLTQEQKVKLDPLTKHERYGKLLIDAMRTWEISKPEEGSYGVQRDTLGEAFDFDSPDKHCCLLGAALYSKKSSESGYDAVIRDYFQIGSDEMGKLYQGFDNLNVINNYNYKEAFDFGQAVREIVLC